jgi:hypothetical protein
MSTDEPSLVTPMTHVIAGLENVHGIDLRVRRLNID